jgi:5'-3' exonuclease
MTILIDAESMLYKATTCNKDISEDGYVHDMAEAMFKFNEQLMLVLNTLWEKYEVASDNYVLFFDGGGNFRKFISLSYKGSRVDRKRPPLIDELKKHMAEQHPSVVAYGYESDDAIASYAKRLTDWGSKFVVCGIDKDLLQIPAIHFDYYYSRMELKSVSREDAEYNFWLQVLMGDKTDDVGGIKGVGPKTAEKLLKGKNGYSMKVAVVRAYKNKYCGKGREKLLGTIAMVKLRTDINVDMSIFF